MSIRWENTLSAALREVLDNSRDLSDDLMDGSAIILAASNARVPTATGSLEASGAVKPAGQNRIAITYGTDHAIYQHEALSYHHDDGSAKFLELALLEKGREAIEKAGENLWRRL